MKEKVKNRTVYTFILICFIIGLLTNNVFANQGVIEYGGMVTSYYSTSVGLFYVDGRIAFCMDHDKETPPNGTAIAERSVYSDPNVIKCLYYGWGGPEQWSGFRF